MLLHTFFDDSKSTVEETPRMFVARLFGSPVSTSVIPFEKENNNNNQETAKMPLDPMDSLWMSKAPQVSDLVVQPNVTFKAVTGGSAHSTSSSIPIAGGEDPIRPDFDTDCLWKPPTRSGRVQKERTISMDSTDSEVGALGGRKFSTNEGSSPVPTSPIEAQPRARRMSISEMLFGSSPKSFSWGMDSNNTTTTTTTTAGGADIGERKMSITDDPRFKDFMKHQSKIIGDDGISSAGFKRSNYMKD
ncbi:Protein CBG01684 [Caenorhabditis briggsae]|uniref:Protein CBG01684 n=4 Tax=Caenorhabditis briggsae TaxID=6238 RepID=A8WR32_CAEBR|nr:Protein CBG01684 [Caenorhabditis briggsae]ULT96433.1 hypothetical protein L3Y34_004790 [Caenorhabditis briggsae]CAP22940.1 Protein CBG01684 [Caenorhabditis briggsae]